MNDKEANEEALEPAPVNAAPVNLAKSTPAQMKNTPINSSNSSSLTKEMLKREKKVMIKISSTERDKSAVFVAVNGVNRLIPRDKWFPIEPCFISALEEAKITEYSVKVDPNGSAEQAQVTTQEVGRFAISTKPVDEPAAPVK